MGVTPENVVIVTGGNRGIGYAICEGLWAAGGYHTIMACRNPTDGAAAKAKVEAGPGEGTVSVMCLDLCNFESVRGFCNEFKSKGLPLNILVTNAGILRWQGWIESKDGFEEHLQANHLGHFLLVRELLPLLLKAPRSRIISVGSELALHASINWDNWNDKVGFDAYMQSKLFNLLHVNELHRRHGGSPGQLRTMCVDPGEANTDIVRHFPMGWAIKIFLSLMPSTLTSQRTIQEGADSAIFCATCCDDTAAHLSGLFVRDRRLFNPAKGKTSLTPFAIIFLWSLASTHSDNDRSAMSAIKVWEQSEKLVDGKVTLPPRMEDKRGGGVWKLMVAFLVAMCAAIVYRLMLVAQYRTQP